MLSRHYPPHTLALPRGLLCCVLLALLPACQPNGPDAPFEIYLKQLGAALQVALPAASTTTLAPFPPTGELQFVLPTDSLDTLDFLSVSGCDIKATLLKRNSSLGRMAKPSQRLLLELEYLRLAPACVRQLRGRNQAPLANLLEGAWQLRREQLPVLIFNATLGSDEYQSFWRSTPAPGQYPRVSRMTAGAALSSINDQVRRWLGGDYRAHNRELELLLSEVAGGGGGALLQALSRQHDWLGMANSMLATHSGRSLSCLPQGRDRSRTQPTDILKRYNNSAIPAHAASLDRRLRRLLPPGVALEMQLMSTLPPSYRTWMDQRNQQTAHFSSAPRRHLEQLAEREKTCAAS